MGKTTVISAVAFVSVFEDIDKTFISKLQRLQKEMQLSSGPALQRKRVPPRLLKIFAIIMKK